MEYIRKFNEKEELIIHLCSKTNIDYEQIDYLLKNGASANAIEIIKYDNNNNELDEEILLLECWCEAGVRFNGNIDKTEKDDSNIKLLKLFMDNGLNVDECITKLLSKIYFSSGQKYYMDIAKILLDNLKEKDKLDVDCVLSNLAIEESYYNASLGDHHSANILSTLYEMIEKTKNGYDYNKYYLCDKVVGQKINSISVFCKDIKIDDANKLISDEFEIIINCENDRLVVFNKYIFVNNNQDTPFFERIDAENYFEKRVSEYLKNETIQSIKFYNKDVTLKSKCSCSVTVIEIKISNSKRMIITFDETTSFMKATIG